MSRTFRKILSHGKKYHDDLFIDVVDDSAAKHRKVKYLRPTKLKPYIKFHPGMWVVGEKHKTREVLSYNLKTNVRSRTGPGANLNLKNANRHMKKSLRQQHKFEIKKEMSLIYEQN